MGIKVSCREWCYSSADMAAAVLQSGTGGLIHAEQIAGEDLIRDIRQNIGLPVGNDQI